MAQVENFKMLGGRYWESTAMSNLLNHYDLKNPFSGDPISEALCMGISGGIGAGYSFCASIPRNAKSKKQNTLDRSSPKAFNESLYCCGSGSALIGRTSSYSTNGKSYRDFFDRLGIKTDIHESTGIKGASKKLIESLEAGKPTVVWSCPVPFSSLGFVGTCGMYTMIVIGIDQENQTATIADRAKTSFQMSLEDLEFCRGRVCSLKNRSLTISPPKSITKATLKSAVAEGIKQTVGNILKPKMKTFGPPGMVGLTKVMASTKNQKGWPKVYPGGTIYIALRDMFDSIETAATGGGFFRLLYADFLEEAAEILNKKNLLPVADEYRDLGDAWTKYGEDLLPNRVKPFKQTKSLLKKLDKSFVDKGAKANKSVEKIYDDLAKIQTDLQKKFVWSNDETVEFLEASAQSLTPLINKEIEVAAILSKAI